MKNNWKTLKKETVFKNHWFKVRKDSVIRPDGKKGFYSFVDSISGVAVIALTPKQEIYLINEWKYPINKDVYTVICGGIEKGESGLSAAKRELEEEAGLKAKNWTSLGQFQTSGALTTEKVHVFLARELSEVMRKPDATEEIEVKKIPLSEAIKMIMQNQIEDSYAITAIFKTYMLIHE